MLYGSIEDSPGFLMLGSEGGPELLLQDPEQRFSKRNEMSRPGAEPGVIAACMRKD